jgi:hypothetical protein
LRGRVAFPYWSDDGQSDADEPEIPAEEDGLKGKLGKAVHRLLDKLDND